MFNSYYANTSPNQKVNVTTPSSIAGTLVKSHVDSKITAVKIGSDEFNKLFGIENQTVSYKKERYCEGSSHYNSYRTTDVFKYEVGVLQSMLANDGFLFVEYVIIK